MNNRVLTACLMTVGSIATAAEKPVIIERVEVRDQPNLNGSVAFTFTKPQGWKHEGSVPWSPFMVHQANIKLRVWSPDSLEQVSTTEWCLFAYMKNPGFAVQRFGDYYGGLFCEPMNPTELHTAMVQHLGPKAPGKIVSQKDLPDLAKAYSQATGMKVRAGKTRVAYRVDGVEVEEDYYLVLGYLEIPTPSGTMYQFYPIVQPLALRAEKGKLDEATPRLAAIGLTIQPTQELGLAVKQGLAGLMKLHFNRLQAIDELSKTISANNDAMISMIRHERQTRWAREDRLSRDFSDYIRGVDRYTDGRTEYTVWSTHQFAWADRTGRVYQTNDANDNPNRHQSGTWSQLRQSR